MSVVAGDEVKAALAAVRKDGSGVTWAVISYKSKNELTVVAQGEGGLEAVIPHLGDSEPFFALIRYDHKVDNSKGVRFAFVDWTPDSVPPLRKALVSTHKGEISKIFNPYHVDLLASDKSDLDENFILQKIGAASGTASHIIDEAKVSSVKAVEEKKKEKEKAKIKENKPIANVAPKVKFANEEEFKAALDVVHKPQGEDEWMAACFGDGFVLKLLGTGKGTTEDMVALFNDETANFGLIRVTDVIDKSVTVKYVYIVYLNDNVSPLKKAKIGTLSGGVKDIFNPIHVDFFISQKNEISHQMVVDKVGSTSGSKSAVRK